MNTDHLFYKLNVECTIIPDVLKFLPTAEWQWVPYQTIATNFPYEILDNDPFLSSIPKKFHPTLRLYKFPAGSVYNWHRDFAFGCSLNMVLDDYQSFTLFNKDSKINIVDQTVELKYQKEKWYLFNSQEMHMVANVGSVDRYLLSVTFPKMIKYKEALEHIRVLEYIKVKESSVAHG
jgi:hypothetical protein